MGRKHRRGLVRNAVVAESPGAVGVGRIGAPRRFVYAFFLVHMLLFGVSGFLIAYAKQPTDVLFLYLHGGLAIGVYTVFYLVCFGLDEVRWMFANAALGAMGIYSQLGWILERFGRRIGDYPLYVHVIPFLYYVLYTFLLRQMVLDLAHAREDARRKRLVEWLYVAASLAWYAIALWRRGADW